MISFILIMLASIFNAVMDVCQFHYSISVFSALNNPKYWDASVSWKNKYIDWDGGDRRRRKLFGLINYPVQLTDAWHLFKMLMIFSIVASIVLYTPLISPMIDFFIYGLSWNLMFGLFYNVILKFKR